MPLTSQRTKIVHSESQPPIQWVDVPNLYFDPDNFRLPEGHGRSQPELLQILDNSFGALEIGESIADNGYFPEEPISAVKDSPEKYTVIEGNRRLAALKFLIDPRARSLSENRDEWEKLAKRMKHDVLKVPVIVYKNRDELVAFLGFRHITGILKWEPLAKAIFIDTLVEKAGGIADFRHVAKTIGSNTPTIRDNYIAYRILLQARDDFDIDTSRLEKNFSVFYRALSSGSISNFIGLKKDRSPEALRKPIPSKSRDVLEKLIGYIHGTEGVEPVITDSRQLTRLGDVLADVEARRILNDTRDLAKAFEMAGGEERRVTENLSSAGFYLDEALRDAHRHTKSAKVGGLVRRCSQSLYQILLSFPSVKEEVFKQRDSSSN